MRQAFAHELWLDMAPEADLRAPGAAITLALCGGWEHDPPCPLAPHHSEASRDGRHVRIRVLFAAAPKDEAEARRLIETAGAIGEQRGLDGTTTRWTLTGSRATQIAPDDLDHGQRLVHSPS